MQSSLDYAGLAQLCGRSPIMRKIMRAHNRVIPASLVETMTGDDKGQLSCVEKVQQRAQYGILWHPKQHRLHSSSAAVGNLLCSVGQE